MKLLHLSDLHIGKRVNEVSILEDQEYILTKIIHIIDEEKPQAVLIAGDVYDKSIPSAEAVTLLDEFLYRLSKRNLQVLIISGNHDSPERLSFGHRFMEGAGIHLAPVYNGKVEPVTLNDEHGEVKLWMLPFVKPIHVRRYFPEACIENYTDAVKVALEHMDVDKIERNILLSHQFVVGAATCESEELNVGGLDQVDASVFEGFDYVALGHIHGPQNIGSNKIRYCGTPLKYSFSEEKHLKSVTMVEIGGKGVLHLQTIPLEPKRDMRQISGTFEKLTDQAYYKNTNTDDYLHVVLTDEEDVVEAIGRLRAIYPNIMKLSYDNARTRENKVIDGAEDVKKKTPLELFGELYELQNNQQMSEVQEAFMHELIESIWEGNV